MNLKSNTIITIENNQKYVLLNEIEYDNKTYYQAMEVNENKEVIPNNVVILKKIVENDEIYVEKINNEKLVAILTEQFQTQTF